MVSTRKRLPDVLLIAVFTLILAAGLAATFDRDRLPEFTERRTLARAPTFDDFAAPLKLPGIVTSYFADQFGFRKFLLTRYFRFKVKLLHADLNLDAVVGKDGWLFLKDEVPDYRRQNALNATVLEDIRSRVDLWCDYANRHGAALALLIAPNKSTIYPDKMPEYLSNFGQVAPMDQVFNAEFSCPVIKVDPRADLRAARDQLLYYKWGTHWNSTAALMVWQQIRAAVTQAVPGLSWLERTPSIREMPADDNEDSMWGWYGVKDPEQLLLPRITFPDFPNGQGTARDANAVRLLAVGDSFMDYMDGLSPGFVGSYVATDPQHVPSADRDILGKDAWFILGGAEIPIETAIEKFKPNVILLEVVERHIWQLQSWRPPPSR